MQYIYYIQNLVGKYNKYIRTKFIVIYLKVDFFYSHCAHVYGSMDTYLCM